MIGVAFTREEYDLDFTVWSKTNEGADLMNHYISDDGGRLNEEEHLSEMLKSIQKKHFLRTYCEK